MRLVLASASPRRSELLGAAGFRFDILPVDVDERARRGEEPRAYVSRLAREKALAAVARLDRSRTGESRAAESASEFVGISRVDGDGTSEDSLVVLGADTAVVVDGGIFGKPVDDEDAARMLRALSGRTHQVVTGVCLCEERQRIERVEATDVEFAELSEADITWYVGTGEGRDKAGAYGIQGLASRFIARIDGSYSNVVGLPVALVHELLRMIASRPQSGYSGR